MVKATELSTLAQRILQNLATLYYVGWSVAEGKMSYDIKQRDPDIVQLFRYPHEFNAALHELAQARYIERHPIFPDWTMLKLPREKA